MPGRPGYVSQTTSKFDNATELHMVPVWASNEGYMQLALFWSTKLNKDTIILETHISPATSFAIGESLKLKIGNNFYGFKAIDLQAKTYIKEGYAGQGIYIPSSSWSSQRYELPINLINNLLTADKPVIRIELQTEYMERELDNSDGGLYYKDPFKEFMTQLSQISK